MNTITAQNEEIIMKLLHYFITTKNYNPVVLYGAKDEIWLENLNSDYKIIRIVSNYIHNNEQLDFDVYRTKQIMKSIKKKTLSINVPTLNIFLNLGDNVKLENKKIDYMTLLNVKDLNDVLENKMILSVFPDITDTLNYKEEGLDLFMRLTTEINKKTEDDAKKAEKVFKAKKPIVTYALIVINLIVFMLMYILGNGSEDALTLLKFGANQRYFVLNLNEYYRLITSSFLHIGVLHLLFNMYALYIIGSQIESFFGKVKYLFIYIVSAIIGALFSICFSESISAGASGAIFGLLGSMLYFGYYYRLYLGTTLRNQIIPIILFNLLLGFLNSGIDNACHIGGLIAGVLVSMIVGVPLKENKKDRINGIILFFIFLIFIIFMLSKIM